MVIVYRSGVCECVYVKTGMTRIEMIDGYAHAYKRGPLADRVIPLSNVLRIVDSAQGICMFLRSDNRVTSDCEEHADAWHGLRADIESN